MGGAKAIPIIAFKEVMGFAGLNLSTCATTGSGDLPVGHFCVESPLQKYFASPVGQIISTNSRHPTPQEGRIAIVTDAGCGCGGRGSVLRAMGSQGGSMRPVSDHQASGREMLQRTAKSCGPYVQPYFSYQKNARNASETGASAIFADKEKGPPKTGRPRLALVSRRCCFILGRISGDTGTPFAPATVRVELVHRVLPLDDLVSKPASPVRADVGRSRELAQSFHPEKR